MSRLPEIGIGNTPLQAFPEHRAPQGEQKQPPGATVNLGTEALSKAGASDMDNQNNPETPGENTRIFTDILAIDTKIKELLARLASSPSMELTGSGASKYGTTLLRGSDSLVRQFEEMFSHIGQLSARGETELPIEAEDDDVVTALRAKARAIHSKLESEVTNAGLDWQLLKSAYTNNVANMDPGWVPSVADAIYSFHDHNRQALQRLLLEVNTFNELLHLSHSYVMHDDSLRDSLEAWSDSSPDHRIRGLGTKNKTTEEIHQAFLAAWRLGNEYEKEGWRQRPSYTVDIVLTGKTLHVIVRDYGHALSLVVDDLTPDQEGKVLVQYHIPNVSNEAMTRQLPGISTMQPGYASGQWTSPVDSLADEIISFVKQVPTDFDNPNIQALFAQKQPS